MVARQVRFTSNGLHTDSRSHKSIVPVTVTIPRFPTVVISIVDDCPTRLENADVQESKVEELMSNVLDDRGGSPGARVVSSCPDKCTLVVMHPVGSVVTKPPKTIRFSWPMTSAARTGAAKANQTKRQKSEDFI